MVSKLKLIGVLVLALVLALIVREVFPKTQVEVVPEIVTRWDTVPDTSFVEIEVSSPPDTIEVVRTVTVTEPDTVRVTPELSPIVGATKVVARGVNPGDTLLVEGFKMEPGDSAGVFIKRRWQANIFVRGPLESLDLGTLPPRATFFEPASADPDACGTKVLFVTVPVCSPMLLVGVDYQLAPPPIGVFPITAWGRADVAIVSKRIRVGLTGHTALAGVFAGVSYRF